MGAAIAGGCDGFSVPSAAAVASTGCAQLSWTGQGSIGGDMTFYMGYVDVMTATDLANMNGAGVFVCVFYENTIGRGPQGALGYTPVNPQYFTYGQGVADGTDARNFASSQLSWPSTRPIYYTVDFASTSSNVSAIVAYCQGVASVDSTAGLYGNGGTLNAVLLTGYIKYFWQNESLGEWNNSTLFAYSSGWQVFNGGHLSLSNGDTAIDGDFAFQSPNLAAGDFGQYPFSGGGGSGNLTNATITNPTFTYTQPEPQAIIVPKYNYDHVIYSDSYTLSTTSSSWPVTLTGPPTGINQYAYPFGNYTSSINGGTIQTNDFGFIFSSSGVPDFGQFPGLLPSVVVQPIVDSSGNVTYDVTVNGVTGAVLVVVDINIALIETYNPSPLPSSSLSQVTAYSNIVPGGQPTPYATYRRISKDNRVGTGATTVAHEQTGIPNVLIWVQDATGTIEMQPVRWGSSGLLGKFGVAMDSTNLYFDVDSPANSFGYYRIYRDN